MARTKNEISKSEQPKLAAISFQEVLNRLEATRDLSGFDLAGVNLSNLDCRACNFAGSKLTGANFDGAILQGCNFLGSDIKGVDFSKADTRWATWVLEITQN
jgi:uncharacterized protein YjbI with pentapeptide repeats